MISLPRGWPTFTPTPTAHSTAPAKVAPVGTLTPGNGGGTGRIAFGCNLDPAHSQGDICVSNLDGSQLRQLTHMPTNQMALSPTWSPDGKRILYRVDTDCPRNCQLDDIWVMNADGSAQTRLTTGTANSSSSMAHWSPDGSKLLYTYSSDTGETSIYVMNANGSGKTRLMDVWSGGGDAAWQP